MLIQGQEEIEEASGSCLVHVPCSADDVLEDMPYADAIIKEVMRLYGIVDGVWRQALEDITVQGHSIRKVSAAPAQCTISSRHNSSARVSCKTAPLAF